MQWQGYAKVVIIFDWVHVIVSDGASPRHDSKKALGGYMEIRGNSEVETKHFRSCNQKALVRGEVVDCALESSELRIKTRVVGSITLLP